MNNAGLALGLKPFQEGNLVDWETMLDTNVKGLLAVTREMLPLFIANKKGHVINIGSTAGHYAYPGGNVYCASKAAIKMLTECLRMDLLGRPFESLKSAPGWWRRNLAKFAFRVIKPVPLPYTKE